MDLRACSLNSATIRGTALTDVIDLAGRQGFGGVGLWRDILADEDLTRAASYIDAAGLRVSSVCRGGMFPQSTYQERRVRLDDNKLAVDQARTLNADCLVLVCGPPIGTDIVGARHQIRDGITELAPYARAAEVALAIEPFHPMLASTRSAITSLGEANQLVEDIADPSVGLAIDSYHVWWDVNVRKEINRSAGRIFSCQLADWVTPINDELTSRGMPGAGSIDMNAFVSDCRSADYPGLVEIEVLSSQWWSLPANETVAAAARALEKV